MLHCQQLPSFLQPERRRVGQEEMSAGALIYDDAAIFASTTPPAGHRPSMPPPRPVVSIEADIDVTIEAGAMAGEMSAMS